MSVYCSVGYCRNMAKEGTYCQKHATNLRRHGTFEAPTSHPTRGAGTGDLVEFIRPALSLSDKGCWLYTRWTERYGQLSFAGENWQAHRWAWVHLAGMPLKRWPEQQLDHICEVTECVRPCHLQIVTQAENNSLKHHPRPEPLPNVPLNLVEWAATVRLFPEQLGHTPEATFIWPHRQGWGNPAKY
ncbi:HNH endonuclease [Kocuria nitroreducens]|uniref:HNH endonuclease n=1 Tax=Kocuria nitroreducens TaxID=3058914 RepID=UPI0036DBD70B